MADFNSPTAICNQALDAAGIEMVLGDIQEGTRAADVCLRSYTECLRQLLRGAPWVFARKEAPLQLIADASGQSSNQTLVPSGFIYSYSYPTDCAKVRYIPWQPLQASPVPPGNITPANPSAPIVTGLGAPPWTGTSVTPARFLVTADPNYIFPGTGIDVSGTSPTAQLIICTNVQSARCVYTFDALYPSLWDHMFRAAMVAYLAGEVALALHKDKKLGIAIANRQVLIAKDKLHTARSMDGNEMWASTDHTPDWIRFRGAGYGYWGFGGGSGGSFWGGWDQVSFSNGSAY